MATQSSSISPSDSSPFTTVHSSKSERLQSLSEFVSQAAASQTEYCTQSNLFCCDDGIFQAREIDIVLGRDLIDRVTDAGENFAGTLFPDVAFGFPINDQFIQNCYGPLLSPFGLLNIKYFHDDRSTCLFLNRIISTVQRFLRNATPSVNIQPLRYFTAHHSMRPV